MSLQYDRLACEQLKEFYIANFDNFRHMKSVILDSLRGKTQFIIKLHDKLKEKLSALPNEGGINQQEIFEAELNSVFDERDKLRTEEAKKRSEFFPPADRNSYQIDKYRAQVLEQKLCLIEEELNSRGVLVKLVSGNVVFEEMVKKQKGDC